MPTLNLKLRVCYALLLLCHDFQIEVIAKKQEKHLLMNNMLTPYLKLRVYYVLLHNYDTIFNNNKNIRNSNGERGKTLVNG